MVRSTRRRRRRAPSAIHLSRTRRLSPPGKYCSSSAARNAMGKRRSAERRRPVCVLSRSRAPARERFFWILTNGVVRRGMPVWSKLPEPQRWQLVTYIKSLGVAPLEGAEETPKKQ